MKRSFSRPASSAAKVASASSASVWEVSAPASTPTARSARTWSRIRAISGEITTVTPERVRAGNW